VKAFGACSFAKRSIEVLCKGTSFEIIEELGIALKKNLDLPYNRISGLSWDHANSEVITGHDSNKTSTTMQTNTPYNVRFVADSSAFQFLKPPPLFLFVLS